MFEFIYLLEDIDFVLPNVPFYVFWNALIPYCRIPSSFLLTDIDPILPNFQFVTFGKILIQFVQMTIACL